MEYNSTDGDGSTFMSLGGVIESIEGSNPFEWIRTQSRHLLPVVCITGIIGNSMALILIRTNFWLKRLTSNVYLCTLSISSCVFLTTVIISWADTYMRLPLFSQTELGCKTISVAAHLSDFICVWMISLISCDRMIVLYRPRIRKWVCTKKFARNMTIGVGLASLILYSWLFLLAGLQIHTSPDGTQTKFCGLSEDVNWFGYQVDQHYFIFTLMDTAICTLLPAIFIIIVNTFSTYRYRQCMKVYSSGVLRVRFVRCPTTEQQPEQLNYDTIQFEETTVKKYLLSTDNPNSNVPTSSTQSRNCGKLRSSDLQLSRTLIIVTSTFVLLNMPSYGMRIFQYLLGLGGPIFNFVYYMTYLLYYLHHAVLFYMYIFWSPQMKKQLKPTAMRLLECYCLKTVPDFGHRSTSTQDFI
uniref:G_PROTEIN_RECEP_F1_2 domain-containing protein n=1 Tax=Caenorhabditis tropicalis TaxID=1561998 RepID=A0A1I7TTK7_9PELO